MFVITQYMTAGSISIAAANGRRKSNYLSRVPLLISRIHTLMFKYDSSITICKIEKALETVFPKDYTIFIIILLLLRYQFL